MQQVFDNDFQALYDVYLEKYGPNLFRETPIGLMETEGSRGSSSRGNLKINLFNIVKNQTAKKQRGEAPSSELARYKGTNFTANMTANEFQNFDIVAWWKGKQSD